eukprot:scaffold2549_cov333-Pavlova_lutheri.AAC.7
MYPVVFFVCHLARCPCPVESSSRRSFLRVCLRPIPALPQQVRPTLVLRSRCGSRVRNGCAFEHVCGARLNRVRVVLRGRDVWIRQDQAGGAAETSPERRGDRRDRNRTDEDPERSEGESKGGHGGRFETTIGREGWDEGRENLRSPTRTIEAYRDSDRPRHLVLCGDGGWGRRIGLPRGWGTWKFESNHRMELKKMPLDGGERQLQPARQLHEAASTRICMDVQEQCHTYLGCGGEGVRTRKVQGRCHGDVETRSLVGPADNEPARSSPGLDGTELFPCLQ